MVRRLSPVLVAVFVMGLAAPWASAGPLNTRTRNAEVTGIVTVLQEDDFASRSTRRVHVIEEQATGKRLRLRFEDGVDARLRSGDAVTVFGAVDRRELRVVSVRHLAAPKAAAAATGERTVIAIVADFQDASVACEDAQIGDILFDGLQSVDGLYRETSFGQLGFDRDANLDGQADVVRVSIAAQAADPCDAYGWAAAADGAAIAAGLDLGPYVHRLYVLPADTQCAWAGLATLGCSGVCRAWVNTCHLPDVYAHELGHNLGMHHSSTDDDNDGTVDCEYCDVSDFMGIGGIGWRQVNGPHKRQMGWLPPSQIVEPGPGDQTVVLSALDLDPQVATFPQLLEIQDPLGGDPYYLSYRRHAGYDQSLGTTYAGKLNIHRHPGGPINTRFIDVLADGATFSDPGAGITFTQLAHDAETATVLVGGGCAPGPPIVTVVPATQTAVAGESRTFTVEVINEDSSACATTTFDLTAVSPGSDWSVQWSQSSLLVDPGDSATSTLTLGSPADSPDGGFVVPIEVTDPSGASGHAASSQVEYVVSTPPPPPPTGLDGEAVRGSLIRLTWQLDPGSAVDGVRVYRDGVFYDTTTGTTYIDWSIAPGGTYTYEVTCVDPAGRESDPSAAVEVTVPATQPKTRDLEVPRPASKASRAR